MFFLAARRPRGRVNHSCPTAGVTFAAAVFPIVLIYCRCCHSQLQRKEPFFRWTNFFWQNELKRDSLLQKMLQDKIFTQELLLRTFSAKTLRVATTNSIYSMQERARPSTLTPRPIIKIAQVYIYSFMLFLTE